MLKKYFTYLKEAASAIDHLLKPDPPGVSAAMNQSANFRNDFTPKLQEAVAQAKKKMNEEFVEILKKDLMGRSIMITNENGHVKILKVNDVILGNNGGPTGEFYPVFFQNKDLKAKYSYDGDKAKIILIDAFLKFFDDNYLGKFIKFNGKTAKSGLEGKFTKLITSIGVNHSSTRDTIVVQDDEGVRYILNFPNTIKIYDLKLKELDPYGEENWEN